MAQATIDPSFLYIMTIHLNANRRSPKALDKEIQRVREEKV
jgi:hypothetical protein